MILTGASRFECDKWFIGSLRYALDISPERVSYKGEDSELFIVYRRGLQYSNKRS